MSGSSNRRTSLTRTPASRFERDAREFVASCWLSAVIWGTKKKRDEFTAAMSPARYQWREQTTELAEQTSAVLRERQRRRRREVETKRRVLLWRCHAGLRGGVAPYLSCPSYIIVPRLCCCYIHSDRDWPHSSQGDVLFLRRKRRARPTNTRWSSLNRPAVPRTRVHVELNGWFYFLNTGAGFLPPSPSSCG